MNKLKNENNFAFSLREILTVGKQLINFNFNTK